MLPRGNAYSGDISPCLPKTSVWVPTEDHGNQKQPRATASTRAHTPGNTNPGLPRSHAPAWECIQRRHTAQPTEGSRMDSHGGPWEPETTPCHSLNARPRTRQYKRLVPTLPRGHAYNGDIPPSLPKASVWVPTEDHGNQKQPRATRPHTRQYKPGACLVPTLRRGNAYNGDIPPN